MAAVYVSNLVIDTGSTFSQTFNLESTETNSPLDLITFISFRIRQDSNSSNIGK